MTTHTDAPRRPSTTGTHVRRITSILLSTLIGGAAAGVLAVHVFLPDADPYDFGAPAMLLRAHQRSGIVWPALPVLALIIAARLPRRGEVPALPFALGWTALALTALALVTPELLPHL